MPAINIPSLNVNAIGEGLKDQKNYEMILDTLQRYRKELNFYLMNLDLDNMPSVGGLIGDLQGNYSLISQTVDGIVLSVGDIEGNVSALQLQAGEILASVQDNTGAIAALSITADGIQTQVSNQLGQISSLQQTAGEIQTTVANQGGQISTLTQTVSGIQSTVSSISGDINNVWDELDYATSEISQLADDISLKVTINDVTNYLSVNRTGVQIHANNIDLTGITTIYSPSNSNTYVSIGGNYADFVLYSRGDEVFEVYDTLGGVAISLMGNEVLALHGAIDIVNAKGEWDFSGATVTGLSGGTLKFA